MKRVVLISGGSSGLGLATTKAFLEKGDTVIVASRSETKFSVHLDASQENLHTARDCRGSCGSRRWRSCQTQDRRGKADFF